MCSCQKWDTHEYLLWPWHWPIGPASRQRQPALPITSGKEGLVYCLRLDGFRRPGIEHVPGQEACCVFEVIIDVHILLLVSNVQPHPPLPDSVDHHFVGSHME